MTAATVAPAAPLVRRGPTVRTVALSLALGGLLMAAGGQLHPHETKDTVPDTLEHYLASSAWDASHLLSLAGIAVAVAGLVLARRSQAFGQKVQGALSVAIWCWGLAAVELVPHVLARRDLDALRAEGSTPILDLHLLLAVFATPLFGLAAVTLAIAVARSAGTKPAWALAVLATIGGLAYAAAGPQIRFVGNVDLSVLFAGQAPVAIWLMGTAVRLAVTPADARGAVSRWAWWG